MLNAESDQKISVRRQARTLAVRWCAVWLLANLVPAVVLAQALTIPTVDNSRPPYIQPVQSIEQVSLKDDTRITKKPLHPLIESTPGIYDEMEIIHRRSQMIVTRSSVMRMAIADPSIIDVVQYSLKEMAVVGLEMGTTTLTIWFADTPEPVIYLVRVIRDPSIEEQKRIDYGKLEKKIAIYFPNSRVQLIPLSYKILVRGQARDAEEAALILQIVRGEVIGQDGSLGGPQNGGAGLGNNGGGVGNINGLFGGNNLASSLIVNMLEIPGVKQVMLHVRVAELNRSMLRRMGVDLNFLLNSGRHVISTTMGGIPASLQGLFENGEISVLLNWLASNGSIKLLAEPSIMALSGHSATFLSGGEFAVPTIVGVGGAQGQTTTFRGFGTSLVVTPTVLGNDLIRMNIQPEFSETTAANSVGGIPGLSTRRANTTVQMREGQTLAIAGLLSHRLDTETVRIPFLGELPFIGPILFNAKRSTNDETELLILVTPEIVRPMESDEVPPVPGHYVTIPNDAELYKYAMTEGTPDTEVYQLAPLGRGADRGIPVGYSVFNPQPASPEYTPVPTSPFGGMPQNQGAPYSGMSQPMRAPQSQPGWGPGQRQLTPRGAHQPMRGPQQLAPVPGAAALRQVPTAGPSASVPAGRGILPAGGFKPAWLKNRQNNSNGSIRQSGYNAPPRAEQKISTGNLIRRYRTR